MFGRALPERFEIADKDRGVHLRREVRARAARERDRLGERQGEVGAGLSRHGLQAAGTRRGLPKTGPASKDRAGGRCAASLEPWRRAAVEAAVSGGGPARRGAIAVLGRLRPVAGHFGGHEGC